MRSTGYFTSSVRQRAELRWTICTNALIKLDHPPFRSSRNRSPVMDESPPAPTGLQDHRSRTVRPVGRRIGHHGRMQPPKVVRADSSQPGVVLFPEEIRKQHAAPVLRAVHIDRILTGPRLSSRGPGFRATRPPRAALPESSPPLSPSRGGIVRLAWGLRLRGIAISMVPYWSRSDGSFSVPRMSCVFRPSMSHPMSCPHSGTDGSASDRTAVEGVHLQLVVVGIPVGVDEDSKSCRCR